MNLLMINIVDAKQDFIINKCIINNVGVFSASSTDEAHNFLTTRYITHIIIDFTSRTNDLIDFIKLLRESEDGNKYQVIAMSNNKQRDFIQSLLLIGIVGFIPGDTSLDGIFDKLNKIMKITLDRDKRRKHFRVSIAKEDEVKINFSLPNDDTLITGKVTDLSIVAIAFKLDSPNAHSAYKEGQILSKVQLIINKKFVLVNIKIIKAGPISVGLLIDIKEQASNIIAHYIYKIMSVS